MGMGRVPYTGVIGDDHFRRSRARARERMSSGLHVAFACTDTAIGVYDLKNIHVKVGPFKISPRSRMGFLECIRAGASGRSR